MLSWNVSQCFSFRRVLVSCIFCIDTEIHVLVFSLVTTYYDCMSLLNGVHLCLSSLCVFCVSNSVSVSKFSPVPVPVLVPVFVCICQRTCPCVPAYWRKGGGGGGYEHLMGKWRGSTSRLLRLCPQSVDVRMSACDNSPLWAYVAARVSTVRDDSHVTLRRRRKKSSCFDST